jgi:hypothetical protein
VAAEYAENAHPFEFGSVLSAAAQYGAFRASEARREIRDVRVIRGEKWFRGVHVIRGERRFRAVAA